MTPELRRSRRRRRLAALGAVVAAVLIVFFGPGPSIAERVINRSTGRVVATSSGARALHASLLIADLHADSLMWGRSLDERSGYGHVDLPRLREGNVALQVFALPTLSPLGQNIDATNAGGIDQITLLGMAQRWPLATWFDLEARAHLHARELTELAGRSDQLFVVRTRSDLARVRPGGPIAGLLAIEGAHCLQGDIEAVDRLHSSGFRMLGLTHFFDNDLGGSAHGVDKGGLTPFGEAVVLRAEALGIAVDLAHASTRVIDDVLARATRPVVVSHTGVRGVCPNNRNLDDDRLRRIAAQGGVVGIGYWPTAVCGEDADAIVRSIRYAADLVGVEHVALGSDYDGGVVVPFDTAGLVAITDALRRAKFGDEDIRKIMGANVVGVLGTILRD